MLVIDAYNAMKSSTTNNITFPTLTKTLAQLFFFKGSHMDNS